MTLKIMIAGAWRWPIYEEAFAKGLETFGVSVLEFSTTHYFSGSMGQLQSTIPLPMSALYRLNRDLITAAARERPQWLLFWRPTHVLPCTLIKLHKLGIRTASYNNDDPFGPRAHGNVPWHHHLLWFWYLRCLPIFDRNFFYRDINIVEAMEYGAQNAKLMLPYFIPWRDHPVILSDGEIRDYATEVVFVGHFEADGRERSIRALIDAGVKVRIWGGVEWERQFPRHLRDRLGPIRMAEGIEYSKALCGAKICLAFLSKLNRDSYTRRCFEIPACGSLMLAERTAQLTSMFKEDHEACFFSSTEELISKVRWLTAHPDIRNNIAAAGCRRVWNDGHDVHSRVRQFLLDLEH